MKDIQLALMTGIDIPIEELQVILHQPTLQEIAYMGEQNFFSSIHHLTLNKESLVQDESLLQNLTNFQVLMKVLEQSETSEKKNNIVSLLSLLFPLYKIILMPKSIILSNMESKQNILIDDNNFDVLQDMIKKIFCTHKLFQTDNIVYNPANAAAKKIADKIMKNRQKIAQINANKQKQTSLLSQYISILTVGIHSMSFKDCCNLTFFQIFDLMERYKLYLKWDIDLRARLAGADIKKEPEDWMKNLY